MINRASDFHWFTSWFLWKGTSVTLTYLQRSLWGGSCLKSLHTWNLAQQLQRAQWLVSQGTSVAYNTRSQEPWRVLGSDTACKLTSCGLPHSLMAGGTPGECRTSGHIKKHKPFASVLLALPSSLRRQWSPSGCCTAQDLYHNSGISNWGNYQKYMESYCLLVSWSDFCPGERQSFIIQSKPFQGLIKIFTWYIENGKLPEHTSLLCGSNWLENLAFPIQEGGYLQRLTSCCYWWLTATPHSMKFCRICLPRPASTTLRWWM